MGCILQSQSREVCIRLSTYPAKTVSKDSYCNDVLGKHIYVHCLSRHWKDIFKRNILCDESDSLSRHEGLYCVGNSGSGLTNRPLS